MAFTKKGSTANPANSPVMNGPGVNKMNPPYPGFPQIAPSTRTSGAVDHSSEIAGAINQHMATKNKSSSQGVDSSNYHLDKSRRPRPHSMETGSQQVAGGARVATPALPKTDTTAPLQAKLKLPGAPRINASMPAGRVTSPKSGL